MPPQFERDKPIYLQVVDQIIQEIVSGSRKAGEKLPSVRELAVESGVNPNTIQRVYRELDQRHITVTRRGQGTFVTKDEILIAQVRESLKQQYLHTFLDDMVALGFTKDDILKSLKEEKTDA
ncbi:transcriptional regulator [Gracilibacillus boraciitolerans JCM 21714]|uniref:Transcriptional regulator n=1 Tax=Gracilibacillus boraciitolerans JCM 21714 TaxID=1298598 RepID=W4VLG5_9BACI|nr:GntR family transcriptional regulator [Gracilibacillus boraciitolerans]GAE94047.1 transcriptional regulator [Gracilibacillus boraciitolerans JCM 21714]